ncbi:MAG: hypothetical protein ABIT38_13695, partial [Gemmatimonadaceae bacterium]
ATLNGLRPDQREVAVPFSLARGDTIRWDLPHGVFLIKYLSRNPGEAPPSIFIEGDAGCIPGDPLRAHLHTRDTYARYCIGRAGGSRVVVAHGAEGLPVVNGALALELIENR